MIPEWCAPHGQPRDCPLHCKRDPTLHEAGVPLEKLVLPPSVSSVSRAFVDMKLVYPAKIAGIAMPWGQKIQLYIFMGQLLQGLLPAWLGTFFKQPNAVFLLANGANFALTFRRDIWLPALLQQLRLLAIYFSIGKWLGAGWKVGTIPEPSWEEMPFKCSELCLVIKIGNLVRNLMPITMVMVGFPTYPAIFICLAPGAGLGIVACVLFNRNRDRGRATGTLCVALLPREETLPTSSASPASSVSTRWAAFVGVLTMTIGLAVSSAISEYSGSNRTYSCGFSKLELVSFQIKEFQLDGIVPYLLFIFAAATLVALAIAVSKLMMNYRSDAVSKQGEGEMATVQDHWFDSSFREFVASLWAWRSHLEDAAQGKELLEVQMSRMTHEAMRPMSPETMDSLMLRFLTNDDDFRTTDLHMKGQVQTGLLRCLMDFKHPREITTELLHDFKSRCTWGWLPALRKNNFLLEDVQAWRLPGEQPQELVWYKEVSANFGCL